MNRILITAVLLGLAASAAAQPKTGPDPKDVQAVIDKAYEFLKSRQKADGSFEPARGGPGTTALIATALIRTGKPLDDPVVAKALESLEKSVKADGGIYNGFIANYTTSIALVTLKEANAGGKYDAIIANAAKFLKGIQQGGAEDKAAYGGYGYDAKSRPDVSNSHFTIEALIAAGVDKDDPAVKNAILFLSRCQNLPGERNKLEFAKKAAADDKGGFVYTPFEQGKKGAVGEAATGPLRSEGGMTYAGLKSFLYAGIGKDDERVKAAVDWIRKHYSLKENPGKADTGLYYYYHVFAKGLDAYGEDMFADAKGTKHNWRAELFTELKGRQAKDGSWTNKNGQFLENVPELATAFALLSVSYTTPKK